MAVQPDEQWRTLVRGLTRASEPDVRLEAARLAASFDPELSRQVLTALSVDANQAVSQEASRVLAKEGTRDLAVLRALLRHADLLTRVSAASTIAELTQ